MERVVCVCACLDGAVSECASVRVCVCATLRVCACPATTGDGQGMVGRADPRPTYAAWWRC
eukprot:scaffold103208_cov70-Phaeocystis_antarctica.AAC.2